MTLTFGRTMQKRKLAKNQADDLSAGNPADANSTPAVQLSSRTKVILSVVLLIHLLAVTAEPLRFFTRSSRGTSPAMDPLRLGLAPYVEFAYLNHGYFFFAPEPGPSHLIDCRLTYSDAPDGHLRFPDKRAQWPRLLYHRHFMLAEFLHQLHVPPVLEEIAAEDPQLRRDWEADRRRFVMVRDSMARHLEWRYTAQSAELQRVEHRLPSSDEVLRLKLPLDDPQFYLILPDEPLLLPESQSGPIAPLPLGPANLGEEVAP